MGVDRRGWTALPPQVRRAVEAHTGSPVVVEPVGSGANSAIAAVVHGPDGPVFVKGLPVDHRQAWTQDREAAIAPHLAGVAPQMLWRVRLEGWDLIGWEHISGRRADFSPGSPDLPLVAELLRLLAERPCPDVPLKPVARWREHVEDPGELDLLDGTALAHTDLNPGNVLVADDGRAVLVDWAWPTRAAAWIDAACWVVWLIASGHTPASAERWAATIPAWKRADEQALGVFATVQARLWAGIATEAAPWTGRVASAAARWQEHRL
ncbi:phosphotransferase family protein [Nocardiopsis suaedae]|uniref:Aminoglycoside phosphotransferase n=1 Tax=Nocardiopsis suaedae TaxID=3018444 RepID=A0ABT4TR44_9ACTN|nr:hypothetical protein [Nocardiopsis suaedae]MDA2807152.1 hypothetical protein [Nocardiopsis suaedae]